MPMTNLAFDTHKFVKDLTKAKMPPEQAEALAYHCASLLNDRIATKDDIRLLQSDINLVQKDLANFEDRFATKDDIRLVQSDINLLRSDFEAKIDSVSKDLWIKVLSTQIATIVVIVGLLKYLP